MLLVSDSDAIEEEMKVLVKIKRRSLPALIGGISDINPDFRSDHHLPSIHVPVVGEYITTYHICRAAGGSIWSSRVVKSLSIALSAAKFGPWTRWALSCGAPFHDIRTSNYTSDHIAPHSDAEVVAPDGGGVGQLSGRRTAPLLERAT